MRNIEREPDFQSYSGKKKNSKLFTYSQMSKIYFSVLDAGEHSTLYLPEKCRRTERRTQVRIPSLFQVGYSCTSLVI